MSANSRLGEQLISLYKQQFTGILTIKSQDGKQTWEMIFYLGKYLWTEGGFHANRAWRRNFYYYCPGVKTKKIILRHQPEIRSHNYSLLNVLLQRKLIKHRQVRNLIENMSKEVLFDLLQKEYNDSLNYELQPTTAHYLLKAGFSLSLASINLEQILFQAQTAWSSWGAKGLASCSPHHAPLLKSDRELQKQIPDLIFSNMSRLLNGKNTLRDLAFKMEKSVLDITCGVVPYFFKGYLRLLEIPDLPKHKI
ncbi:MAG: DUF4388 domain-containing protein [Pleurocapsa sp.]